MQVHNSELNLNRKPIKFTHIDLNSKSICFMLSGGGYNYDKPLFYYSTMVMIKKNIDVVHIHYSYNEQTIKKPITELAKIMMDDIDPVISDILNKRDYQYTIFLGKSLGTIPIAIELMKRDEFFDSKMVLLTPLLKFNAIFDSILNSQHHGLLVIGDQDKHYNTNQIDQLRNTNFEIEVFGNTNHSLDDGEFDAKASIGALSRVMKQLQEMI
ncbi:alpha/beta hydrolase [Lysinibacillus fusiformis]|nr:alpha/beta hydrolase [Lysinibacillus fusiformis]